MREFIKDFAQLAASHLTFPEPIFEFGALQVPGQEGFADLRPLFRGKEYVGCDMREGPGVDRILNLHHIDLPDESVGSVISLDTLEHVEYPHRAMEEIHRVIKPGGLAVISSVMRFPIHDFPYDYWRFTPEAFRSILKPFESSFVGFAGEELFPHTVVGIGFKGTSRLPEAWSAAFDQWQATSFDDSQESRPKKLLRSLIPPIVLEMRRRLLGRGK